MNEFDQDEAAGKGDDEGVVLDPVPMFCGRARPWRCRDDCRGADEPSWRPDLPPASRLVRMQAEKPRLLTCAAWKTGKGRQEVRQAVDLVDQQLDAQSTRGAA